VLGGAGLAGLADRIAPLFPAPLVDPVQVSVAVAEARTGARNQSRTPSVETEGLHKPLARLFTAR
jgi:Asp/Glu/hydantoin racemase